MLLPEVKQAADKMGGIQKLADAIGITRQAIYMWDKVPVERAVQIAKAAGMPRSYFRPDVFTDDQDKVA